MLRHISANSVNEALFFGLQHIAIFGVEEESRNGAVLVAPAPVITTYRRPRNRVLINNRRDANPFFHLFESLWMLAGRNDLEFCQRFISNFDKFSDDGETLHGAYGYRWRKWFGYDQLVMIIDELKRDPKSRRCVLSMWDASSYTLSGMDDPHMAALNGRDVPCNTQAYFDTIGDKLNMTVTCRSNDVILGCYGANAVHFSILLEYMALMTGLPLGEYRQFSNNFHIYMGLYPEIVDDRLSMEALAKTVAQCDIYSKPGVAGSRDFREQTIQSPPLINGDARSFHEDIDAFMELDTDDFESEFFKCVVGPMYRVWASWKAKEYSEARHLTLAIRADDWRLAAQDWLSIREMRRVAKELV